ncbi:MAG: hypothetical protein MUF87_10390 [Anaerolineae bacterium]|jgi:hypothetical protein|nr:hypothetical protein [Anaerolineae bacterium]
MPISLQRIDHAIYLANYTDVVTLEDFYGSLTSLERFLSEDQAQFHVVILRAQNLKKIPFELQALSKSITPQRAGTLIVNAPLFAQMLGNMVSRFSGHPLEFFDSLEAAIDRAHEIMTLIKST